MTAELEQPSQTMLDLEARLQELLPSIKDGDIQTQLGRIVGSKIRSVSLDGSMRAEKLGVANAEFLASLRGISEIGLLTLIGAYTDAELEVAKRDQEYKNRNHRKPTKESVADTILYKAYNKEVAEGTRQLNRRGIPSKTKVFIARAIELSRAQRDSTVMASQLQQKQDLIDKIAFLRTVQAKLKAEVEALQAKEASQITPAREAVLV